MNEPKNQSHVRDVKLDLIILEGIKMNKYDEWTFDELYQECVSRGILDGKGNYVKHNTPEIQERRKLLRRFMENNKLTYDEILAFSELAEKDDTIRKFVLDAISENKNIR